MKDRKNRFTPPQFSKGFLAGILCASIVLLSQPVQAEVGDNLGSAFTVLADFLGVGKEDSDPSTYGGSLVERMDYVAAQNKDLADTVEDLQSSVAQIELSVSNQAETSELQNQMAVSSTLQNFLDSGATSISSWSASDIEKKSIATSTQMINSKYSYLALDYCILESLIPEYLESLIGYSGNNIDNIDTLSELENLKNLTATDWGKNAMGAPTLSAKIKSNVNSGIYDDSITKTVQSGLSLSNIILIDGNSGQGTKYQDNDDSDDRVYSTRGNASYVNYKDNSCNIYGNASDWNYWYEGYPNLVQSFDIKEYAKTATFNSTSTNDNQTVRYIQL